MEKEELSRYPVCICTMLNDKPADVEGEIEINLSPVGEIADRYCGGFQVGGVPARSL